MIGKSEADDTNKRMEAHSMALLKNPKGYLKMILELREWSQKISTEKEDINRQWTKERKTFKIKMIS